MTQVDPQIDPSADADDVAAPAESAGRTGRGFALFGGLILLAHLGLPWYFMSNGPGQYEPVFWPAVLRYRGFEEGVLYQVAWMGVAMVCLLLASVVRRRRSRAMLLIAVGTMGLLLGGWTLFTRIVNEMRRPPMPGELSLLLLCVALLSSLTVAELRALTLAPHSRSGRWSLAVMGLLLIAFALAALVMTPWSSDGTLLDLLPEPGATGRLAAALAAIPSMALLLTASGLCLLLPLLRRPRRVAVLAQAIRYGFQASVLLLPVAALAVGVLTPPRAEQSLTVTRYFETRLVVVAVIYWFALSIGGGMLLTPPADAEAEEEETF